MSKITENLGENYQERILTYLATDRVLDSGYAPTWWISCNHNWVGKTYWLRKALNEMQKNGLVESFKHRGGVGWCWALKGKMRKW